MKLFGFGMKFFIRCEYYGDITGKFRVFFDIRARWYGNRIEYTMKSGYFKDKI
jgi:hypothetical protein